MTSSSSFRAALRRQHHWFQQQLAKTASSGRIAPRRRLKRLYLQYQQRVRQQTPALRDTAENLVVVKRPVRHHDKNDPTHATATSTSTTTAQTTSFSSSSPPDMNVLIQRYYQQIQTVPNMLTLSRIAMAPCISYWILSEQLHTAGVACIVAGVTDVLDGWIAKTWPRTQATALGTYLDPMADKVLINTVACSLGVTGVLAAPLVTLWLAKDVALMTATYWHVRAATRPRARSVWQVIDPVTVPLRVIPTPMSKLNTGLQFVTLATALYAAGPSVALTTLSWVTGTTTVASVLSYSDYSAFRPTQKKDKK